MKMIREAKWFRVWMNMDISSGFSSLPFSSFFIFVFSFVTFCAFWMFQVSLLIFSPIRLDISIFVFNVCPHFWEMIQMEPKGNMGFYFGWHQHDNTMAPWWNWVLLILFTACKVGFGIWVLGIGYWALASYVGKLNKIFNKWLYHFGS